MFCLDQRSVDVLINFLDEQAKESAKINQLDRQRQAQASRSKVYRGKQEKQQEADSSLSTSTVLEPGGAKNPFILGDSPHPGQGIISTSVENL
jgi:hypothetical protein